MGHRSTIWGTAKLAQCQKIEVKILVTEIMDGKTGVSGVNAWDLDNVTEQFKDRSWNCKARVQYDRDSLTLAKLLDDQILSLTTADIRMSSRHLRARLV